MYSYQPIRFDIGSKTEKIITACVTNCTLLCNGIARDGARREWSFTTFRSELSASADISMTLPLESESNTQPQNHS